MLHPLPRWCLLYVQEQTAESGPKATTAVQVVTYLGGKQHVNAVTNIIAECEYCERREELLFLHPSDDLPTF